MPAEREGRMIQRRRADIVAVLVGLSVHTALADPAITAVREGNVRVAAGTSVTHMLPSKSVAPGVRSTTTGALVMTGLRVEPRNVTTGALAMTGLRVEPRSVTTGALSMTGLRAGRGSLK